jgi:anhydro-N-acetylmuramic acid kinase
MNPDIEQLYRIAKKSTRLIIGLMSGTSLDGLDVALCRIKGSGLKTQLELLEFETIAFQEDFKNEIRKVFAKETIDFKHLTLLNVYIANHHSDIILHCIQKWKLQTSDIDLIASHGQTVMHVPSLRQLANARKAPSEIRLPKSDFQNATLQIGDGDHIAMRTGIITISDFRQKHVAAGGEGAPLAVYGDYYLFSKKGQNRILLNMGGIANFTHLPKSADPAQVFTTDTGTGNTLLDAIVQQEYPSMSFDTDAKLASSGKVSQDLLAALKDHPFFSAPFPKTTGPELFNKEYIQQAKLKSNTQGIKNTDLLATLTQFSAETIADAIKTVWKADEQYHIYLSGGGAHNPLLVTAIKKQLPKAKYSTTQALAINGDAKEAVLFATLANECIAGKPDFGNAHGVPSVKMGKISLPK